MVADDMMSLIPSSPDGGNRCPSLRCGHYLSLSDTAEFLMSGQNGTKCTFTEVRIFRFFSLNNQRPDKLCSSSTISPLDIFRLGCRHGHCHRRTNLFVAMSDRAHLAIVAREAIEDITRVQIILFKEEQGKRNYYQSQKYSRGKHLRHPGIS